MIFFSEMICLVSDCGVVTVFPMYRAKCQSDMFANSVSNFLQPGASMHEVC